jgi:hypothetical protein
MKVFISWHAPCFIENHKTTLAYAFVFPTSNLTTVETGGEKMKKLAIQLFVIGTIIATYALPVLARGGPGF